MGTHIVFETHSWSEDNERGIATGWLPGRLSSRGRTLAAELGDRRRHDGLSAVFTSDLRRAVETAEVAFAGSELPVFADWRLRECDYGDWNGLPALQVHGQRSEHLDEPYPGGESWRQAVARVTAGLDDIAARWDGGRVLVIGHVATRWALETTLEHVPLQALLAADFEWQPGWEYERP